MQVFGFFFVFKGMFIDRSPSDDEPVMNYKEFINCKNFISFILVNIF